MAYLVDIDECITSAHQCVPYEQVCYNQDGSYTCINPDGSTSQPGSQWPHQLGWGIDLNNRGSGNSLGAQGFPGASNEASYVAQGICPPGYTFNLNTRACDGKNKP